MVPNEHRVIFVVAKVPQTDLRGFLFGFVLEVVVCLLVARFPSPGPTGIGSFSSTQLFFRARNISVICAIVDLCARYTLYFGPAQATREVLLSRLHPILSPSYIVIKRDYSLPPAAVLLNWR